ncbi:MAG: C40 family peptidase [Oscillospiraceae bacterium]|nr:C40 family peptidase [Oscillospiraceae bacterium]MBR6862573.1 C40 family peptidase [Acidaminococcaceae bacterium]
MIQRKNDSSLNTAKQTIALLIAMILMSALVPGISGHAEEAEEGSRCDAYVNLDNPEFIGIQSEEEIPVITSVGKVNVRVHGVKSRGSLVKYTIPEQLLAADPDFLALMVEAEKYIGYPYVYGAGNPDTGFDCSGFVCWVFNQSGVYKTRRLGATGLYAICEDIPTEEARPGDLVFFEKTIDSTKGITHVGIYVGNGMMIHAGDPVGFADLKNGQWARKIYAYGRLPID